MSLAPYTTLKVGGYADKFAVVRTSDQLAEAVVELHQSGIAPTVLGWGSNLLPADEGVPGVVLLNGCRRMMATPQGEVIADSGCGFQDLFLKAAQQGLRGLEFAVGIPGTIGGALVSNAGAYRSCVSEFLTGIEVVVEGRRQWVDPSWMEFSYRDSRLRRDDQTKATIIRVAMKLPLGDPKKIYDEARDFQRQRIGKQPPNPSAGSFFKNVVNVELASELEGLTDGMRKAGVVPAGFLIEAAGLKGHRVGGAMMGVRHANFILNVAGATATDVYELAQYTKGVVHETFGVLLEEEVLYIGRWPFKSGFCGGWA